LIYTKLHDHIFYLFHNDVISNNNITTLPVLPGGGGETADQPATGEKPSLVVAIEDLSSGITKRDEKINLIETRINGIETRVTLIEEHMALAKPATTCSNTTYSNDTCAIM